MEAEGRHKLLVEFDPALLNYCLPWLVITQKGGIQFDPSAEKIGEDEVVKIFDFHNFRSH